MRLRIRPVEGLGPVREVTTTSADMVAWERYARTQRPPLPMQPNVNIGSDGKPSGADFSHFPTHTYYAFLAHRAETRSDPHPLELDEWLATVREVDVLEDDTADDGPRPIHAAL